MGSIFIFIGGALFGWLLNWLSTRKRVIGTLRVDCSDPDFQCLFLELDQRKSDCLYTDDYITLRVDFTQN